MEQPYLYALALLGAVGLITYWRLEELWHGRKLNQIGLRIHVNGIRGKSTVTRILAGMLRNQGLETVAKTTGSAACVIDSSGRDQPIRRQGAATILEQVQIVRRLATSVGAMVIECMAIKPEYQSICEEKIVRSNIGVITNVREDHQDVLGESLEEIAFNLLSTCPRNGVLITSETNDRLIPIFRQVAEARNTQLIVADLSDVSDKDLNAFSYIAFKENVAIGFALAKLLNIEKSIALQGMVNAAPDPGVLRISKRNHRQTKLTWADLFAVNDRESVIACVNRVVTNTSPSTIKVGLLNNREDREYRAIQFAEIAARDLEFDYVVLLGAYERKVASVLIKEGFPRDRIIPLTATQYLDGTTLIEEIIRRAGASERELLLFGLVNIHTCQAEQLREWFVTEAEQS